MGKGRVLSGHLVPISILTYLGSWFYKQPPVYPLFSWRLGRKQPPFLPVVVLSSTAICQSQRSLPWPSLPPPHPLLSASFRNSWTNRFCPILQLWASCHTLTGSEADADGPIAMMDYLCLF